MSATPYVPKICCLLDYCPFPAHRGIAQRLEALVSALVESGPVDLLIARDLDAPAREMLRTGLGVNRVVSAAPLKRRGSRLTKIRRAAAARLPLGIANTDLTPLREAFQARMAAPYDVAFVSGPHVGRALSDLVGGPVIVDLPFLMQRGLQHADAPRRSGTGRWTLEGFLRRRLWKRFERGTVLASDVVLVCSDVDRTILGGERVRLLPNGCTVPDNPAGRPEIVRAPPTLVFQGYMRSPQNADAAEFFVGTILPLLRAAIPSVQVRIVGIAGRRVTRLARHPGVTVTGWVPDMAVELARADAAVVPLRMGSGTRLKILESWSNRLPVVSTRVGAEGLGAVDGEHLLLADTAAGFAAACARVLSERDLRMRLTEQALALVRERYQWDSIKRELSALVTEVAANRGRPLTGAVRDAVGR